MSAISNKGLKATAWLRRLKPVHWLAIVIVVFLSFIPFTPGLIGFTIKHVAKNQGYVINYLESSIKPTEGTLEYQNLEVIFGNKTLFSCGHCQVTIDIGEALDERYVIRQAKISKAKFDYEVLPQAQQQSETATPYWQIDQLVINELELMNLPQLDKKMVSIHQVSIENLNRDSTKPGRVMADVGYGPSRLTLSGGITTSPYPDFDSLDVSLKQFNVNLIPAEYRILQFQLAGVVDLHANLSWTKKEGNKRELSVRNLEYLIHDASIMQEQSGTRSLNVKISGNGKITLDTGELPERIIYEQVSYNGKIGLNTMLTDGVTADRPLVVDDMQLDITAKLGHGENRETLITSKVQIPSMNHVLPDNIKITGSTSWAGDTSLKFQTEEPNFRAVHTGKLAGSVSIASDESRGIPNVDLKALEFSGELSQTKSDDQPLIFQMKGNITAESVSATQIPERPGVQLILNQPGIDNLVANTFPVSLDIEKILSKRVEITDDSHRDGLPISDVVFESLAFRDNRLAIQSLSLGHIGVNIHKPESGDIQVSPGSFFSSAETKESQDQSQDEQDSESELSVFIDSLKIGKDSFIKFTDHSVDPNFQTQLVISSASVKQLSLDSDKPTTFEAEGKLGQRGEFTLEGNFQKSGDSFDLETASRITSLSLNQFSQYTGELIGYQMDKGFMDLKIDGTIKKKQLNGESKLLITGLKVTPLNNEAQKQFDKSVGLSLTSAVSMLADNKGHIDLKVPISGDIDNPDFGMGDVISKALDEGLKAGLLLAFQPLGLAVLAVDAMSKLGGIPLGEIEFEPGSAELDSIDAERLTLLAEKMQEKPGTRLKICAIALENELPPDSLLKKSGQEQPKSASDQQPTKPADPEFTRTLASQRLTKVRDFLIEQKVGDNRFEECAPEVASPENNKSSAKLILTDITQTAGK